MNDDRGTWLDSEITNDPRIADSDPVVREAAMALHRNESMHLHWYIDRDVCPYCALRASLVVAVINRVLTDGLA